MTAQTPAAVTGTLTRPVLPGRDHADEGAVHITCCDDNIAMCGLDLSDHNWADADDDNECRVCRIVEDNDLPCPVPGCNP